MRRRCEGVQYFAISVRADASRNIRDCGWEMEKFLNTKITIGMAIAYWAISLVLDLAIVYFKYVI